MGDSFAALGCQFEVEIATLMFLGMHLAASSFSWSATDPSLHVKCANDRHGYYPGHKANLMLRYMLCVPDATACLR